ncbi:hypothetical protein GCM10011491_14810 [Brucella endophytica]|uniref:Uncharacterized protein n=1 Tax=Brucella endophytica TaxID=1963359 RepID=A0A916S812_9HYPH|nr:hypothetical protein GCM10011491_14810 [Brucella endophytica]
MDAVELPRRISFLPKPVPAAGMGSAASKAADIERVRFERGPQYRQFPLDIMVKEDDGSFRIRPCGNAIRLRLDDIQPPLMRQWQQRCGLRSLVRKEIFAARADSALRMSHRASLPV